MPEMVQLETHPSVILKVRADMAHQCWVCSQCRGTGEDRVTAQLLHWIVSEIFPCPSCGGRGHFWFPKEADHD